MAPAPLSPRQPAGADRSVLWSLAGHGVLLLIVVIGGISLSRTPPPSQLAIKATVVDPTARRPAKPVRKPAPEPQPAPMPAPEPKPELKPEPKAEPKAEPRPTPQPDPAVAQRQEEQQKQAREKAKAAALARQEQARREKQQAEKAAEKERQAKAEAEKKLQAARQKAEAERQQAAADSAAQERERNRELEEEERLLAAADSGALADYVALIRQRVERNWVRPASARPGLECDVRVTQIPGGEVTAVQMDRCNADEAVRRSIEAAVMKASPLPLPDDATLFERNLRFTFKPEQ